MLKLILCLVLSSATIRQCDCQSLPPVIEEVVSDIEHLKEEIKLLRELIGESDDVEEIEKKVDAIQQEQINMNRRLAQTNSYILGLDARITALEGNYNYQLLTVSRVT